MLGSGIVDRLAELIGPPPDPIHTLAFCAAALIVWAVAQTALSRERNAVLVPVVLAVLAWALIWVASS